MTTSATGNGSSRSRLRTSEGFTLVELLSVVVIMAIMMSVLALALRNMTGPSTQVAAAQVASGLSLARQIAVSRATDTRFIIYPGSSSAASDPTLPSEAWRYWTVVSSNRDQQGGAWIMEKEWERLPAGAVFLNIAVGAYSTINEDPIRAKIGQPFSPVMRANIGSGNEWQGYESFGSFQVGVRPTNASLSVPVAFDIRDVPAIGFNMSGGATLASGAPLTAGGQAVGLRIAEGSVTPDRQILLKTTNNYHYVETDKVGRIRVRARETYR